ncbi:MAG: SPOR domain-containing protein [Candidatus Omnitrophota bacterium]
MNEEHQKEFFKDFDQKNGKIKKISDKITERRKKMYINLGLENIIFAIILVIMCVIAAFALGTEHGKRISSKPMPQKIFVKNDEPIPAFIENDGLMEKDETEPDRNKKELESARYVIQLISYTDMASAVKEQNKLLNKNIHAVIIPSGKWYQIRVGGYNNIKDAKKALEEFSKDYNGCFIRNTGR